MTVISQRIIFSDNGTLSDLSMSLNKISAKTATLPWVAAEDYLYIGSDLPFSHRYFWVNTANTASSNIAIEIWDGTSWVAAVDIQDGTSLSGASFGQSGIVSFTVDRNESWVKEDTSEDVTGLSSLKIYRKYWLRISFTADLDVGTVLSYIGHKFADDSDLTPMGYPDLERSDVKTGFEAGKTNWDEQHLMAAESIISYLVNKDEVQKSDQILDWQQFEQPAVHMMAHIVYRAFGDDFVDQRDDALQDFDRAMERMEFTVDKDGDGRTDDHDVFKNPHNLTRV